MCLCSCNVLLFALGFRKMDKYIFSGYSVIFSFPLAWWLRERVSAFLLPCSWCLPTRLGWWRAGDPHLSAFARGLAQALGFAFSRLQGCARRYSNHRWLFKLGQFKSCKVRNSSVSCTNHILTIQSPHGTPGYGTDPAESEPFHLWGATCCSRELYWLGELVPSLARMTLVSLGKGEGQGGKPTGVCYLGLSLLKRRVQVA